MSFFTRSGLARSIIGAVSGLSIATMIGRNLANAAEVGTPGPYYVTVKAPIRYAHPAADTMIECKPSARPGHYAGPAPVVMLIHGGAWSGGTNAVGPGYTGYSSSWCTLWASWGFDAFSVGYRSTKVAPWPAQAVDVQAAIRWVRANARWLHVNPGLIGVDGDSAGGQIAMIVGYNYRNLAGDLAWDNAAQSPQPEFVISQFGPWTWGPSGRPGAPSARAVDHARQLLVDIADRRTRAGAPKTLFVQGTQDKIVNQCSESEPAYRFLKSNRRAAAYLAYRGGHEFMGMNHATWSTEVGRIQVQTISFAYARAHASGVLPRSETGPSVAVPEAHLPAGCP